MRAQWYHCCAVLALRYSVLGGTSRRISYQFGKENELPIWPPITISWLTIQLSTNVRKVDWPFKSGRMLAKICELQYNSVTDIWYLVVCWQMSMKVCELQYNSMTDEPSLPSLLLIRTNKLPLLPFNGHKSLRSRNSNPAPAKKTVTKLRRPTIGANVQLENRCGSDRSVL